VSPLGLCCVRSLSCVRSSLCFWPPLAALSLARLAALPLASGLSWTLCLWPLLAALSLASGPSWTLCLWPPSGFGLSASARRLAFLSVALFRLWPVPPLPPPPVAASARLCLLSPVLFALVLFLLSASGRRRRSVCAFRSSPPPPSPSPDIERGIGNGMWKLACRIGFWDFFSFLIIGVYTESLVFLVLCVLGLVSCLVSWGSEDLAS